MQRTKHRLLPVFLTLVLAQVVVLGLPLRAVAKVTDTSDKASATRTATSKTTLTTRVRTPSGGWVETVGNGRRTGDVGRSRYINAMRLRLSGKHRKSIAYRIRFSGSGWQSWRRNGRTAGRSKGRVEAVQIKLTGDAGEAYDVYYRVHVQDIGWMAWTSNGESAGTIGLKLGIEAIQVRLVRKGKSVSLSKGDYPGALVNTRAKKPKRMTVKVLHQMEHGYKSPIYQRCIVMHDTEEHRSFNSWGRNWIKRGGVGTQFMVSRTGKIRQYASMNQICWHAGGATYARLNKKFGVVTHRSGAGSAMNQCSIGIEMDHVAGEDYPEAQLDAVDSLIAYIDAYYGYQCTILQHRDYRLINSDCSKEFQPYLRHLKKYRSTR